MKMEQLASIIDTAQCNAVHLMALKIH